MEPNKNYVMVGAFVLLGLFACIAFALWLTSTTEKRDYGYYRIRFRESVGGLSNGSSVKYRGVDVGNVVAIKIDRAETNAIMTSVRILRDAPVKQDTVATLKIQGITGASYIELSGGETNQPDLVGAPKEKGDLPEIPAVFSNMATLSNEIPELINKTSYVASQAGRLIDDEAVAHMQAIMKRWDNISTLMEKEAAQLDGLMQSTKHLVATTDKVMTQVEGANIGGTLQDLHEATAQLKEFTQQNNQAASASLEDFNALLLDAKKTSKDLRNLTRSLSENPSQIIFPTHDRQEKLP